MVSHDGESLLQGDGDDGPTCNNDDDLLRRISVPLRPPRAVGGNTRFRHFMIPRAARGDCSIPRMSGPIREEELAVLFFCLFDSGVFLAFSGGVASSSSSGSLALCCPSKKFCCAGFEEPSASGPDSLHIGPSCFLPQAHHRGEEDGNKEKNKSAQLVQFGTPPPHLDAIIAQYFFTPHSSPRYGRPLMGSIDVAQFWNLKRQFWNLKNGLDCQ